MRSGRRAIRTTLDKTVHGQAEGQSRATPRKLIGKQFGTSQCCAPPPDKSQMPTGGRQKPNKIHNAKAKKTGIPRKRKMGDKASVQDAQTCDEA